MDDSAEAPALARLPNGFKKTRVQVETALAATLKRHEDSIYFTALTNALQGGKRFRPIVLLLAFESVGGQAMNPLPAAVAVELVHTESLIHDDLIDRDSLRREQKAFYTAYGYEMALLSADFVLSLILELTAYYTDPRITRALARAVSEMCEGELEELMAFKAKQPITAEAYLKIISKKTASLFEASARIGAILGGAREEAITALSEYGRRMGIAYQILDDRADLTKSTAANILTLLDAQTEDDALHTICADQILKAKQALTTLGKSRAQDLLIELAEAILSSSMRGLSNRKGAR